MSVGNWVDLPRRATQEPSQALDTDVAWLAGLLEGEGSFMLSRNIVKGTLYLYPAISVNMTDYDVILRISNLFGTTPYEFKKAYGVSKKKSWRAMVRGENAVAWMKLILPYMGNRRSEKIQEVLAT